MPIEDAPEETDDTLESDDESVPLLVPRVADEDSTVGNLFEDGQEDRNNVFPMLREAMERPTVDTVFGLADAPNNWREMAANLTIDPPTGMVVPSSGSDLWSPSDVCEDSSSDFDDFSDFVECNIGTDSDCKKEDSTPSDDWHECSDSVEKDWLGCGDGSEPSVNQSNSPRGRSLGAVVAGTVYK